MAVPLDELKVELETDPVGMNYNFYMATGDMVGVAFTINDPNSVSPRIDVAIIPKEVLNEGVIVDELMALSPARQMLWQAFTRESIDTVIAPNLRQKILDLFPVGNVSRGSLQQVWSRQSGRGEELWGVGTVVTWEECAAALALP